MKIDKIIVLGSCVEVIVSVETYRSQLLLLEAIDCIIPFNDDYALVDGKLFPKSNHYKIPVEYSKVSRATENSVRMYFSKLDGKKR